jgi:hypothetical protein
LATEHALKKGVEARTYGASDPESKGVVRGYATTALVPSEVGQRLDRSLVIG